MDILNKLWLALSIIFVFAFIINPPLHKIFRNKKTYNYFLFFSIILPLISFLTLFGEIEKQKLSFFITLSPLIFLLLYKYFDNRILKKFNRNIYFYNKYNVLWKDEESDYTTSTDNWFQFVISLAPLFLLYGIGWITLEIIRYCC